MKNRRSEPAIDIGGTSRTNDHFVPVVYLSHFVDPTTRGRVRVYWKRTGQVAPMLPSKICRQSRGDLNRYFSDPAILKEFLKIIEPRWTRAVGSLTSETPSPDAIFVAAGMAAYLLTCSPTARRLGTSALEQHLENARPMMARQALSDIVDPEEAQLIADGLLAQDEIRVEVDPHYPRALAISHLVTWQAMLMKGDWHILENDSERKLITSDFPACYYYRSPADHIAKIYLPITPTHALLIAPSLEQEDAPPRIAETECGPVRRGRLKPFGLELFNGLVARCAEDMVIAAAEEEWTAELVAQYRDWRMEALVDKLPTEGGYYEILRYRPRQRSA